MTIGDVEAATPARPRSGAPLGRREVAIIVAIGYLAAGGAVAATLLIPSN